MFREFRKTFQNLDPMLMMDAKFKQTNFFFLNELFTCDSQLCFMTSGALHAVHTKPTQSQSIQPNDF